MKNLALLFAFLFTMLNTSLYSQDTITLCAVAINDGSSVELQIKVMDFNNIASFQFATAWDQNQYSFDSIGNLNPSLEASGDISFSNETFNVPDDIELILSLWFNAQGGGSDLSDGDVLYSVFLTNNSPGTFGYFGIVEHTDYFQVEVSDGNLNLLEVDYTGDNCLSFRFSDLTSSIESIVEPDLFSINGNPTSGIIKIESDIGPLDLMEIYTADGKLVQKFENIPNGQTSFDVSSLSSGTYLVSIVSASGSIHGIKKLIIQK